MIPFIQNIHNRQSGTEKNKRFPVVVQSLSHVQLFATPWTAVCQTSVSFTISQSFLKLLSMGFPSDSVSKEYPCNVRDMGSIPGLGRPPGGGYGNPLQYYCLEKPHGQRSLVGYSPWGHKELDVTE